MVERGSNNGKRSLRVGFYLHLTCQKHSDKTYVKDFRDFRALDGGCTKACREMLSCGHLCALNCHPFSHDLVKRLECCTPYPRINHQARSPGNRNQPRRPFQDGPPAQLIDVTDIVEDTTRRSPPTLAARAPLNTEQETKAYKDYAAVGHIESDKTLAAMAGQNDAKARQERLDKENFQALFSDENIAKGGVLTGKKPDNVTLVRTKTDGQGGSRRIWKGNIEIARKDENGKEGSSLLDLV